MNTPVINSPSLQHLGDQSVHVLEETTIIGRHEDCNLVLKSERGASRKHARIIVENNTAILMDLGSLNGTMVNGREISRAVQLADGDIIVFDEQEYRFLNPEHSVQNSGDNVTVIANKDEIGRPESIKPAIRMIDQPGATSDTQTPEYSSSGSLNGSLDDTEAWEIPATSRPGGDAQTPRRLQNRQRDAERSGQTGYNRRPAWLNWAVIIPLLILIVLIAFYFAYTTGFSAGVSGSSNTNS